MTILRCKVAIIGDCKVGKTSLTTVFHKNKQFQKNYVMTLGVDFCVKTVKIPDSDYLVELYLYDTSGHDVYKELHEKYWSNTSLLMLCYDPSVRSSFDHVTQWADKALKCMSNKEKFKGILVSLKSDLSEYTTVRNEEIQDVLNKYGLAYFETSALLNKDVDAPFNCLASMFHRLYEEKLRAVKDAID